MFRRPRPAGRRLRRTALAGALSAALLGGAAVAVTEGGNRLPVALALPRTDVFTGERGRPADGPGLTFLLVGLDTRKGIPARERKRLHVGGRGCDCTDTMMLLHVSEDRRRVSVLSIPRDSYVPFARPAAGATPLRPVPRAGKINGAYAAGGPALTVRTVEQVTGVRVDHYLEADFRRFVRAVDALGGATVCTGKPLRDRWSGLDLPAGTHRVDGRGALRYVRARHLPPSGDLGRMRRQQAFLAEAVDRIADEGLLRDPAALARTARALLTTLRADSGLTTERLVTLGRALRGLDSRRAEFATVPLAEFDHRVPGWGSTLVWDRPRAERLFAALREDRPLTGQEAYRLPGPGVPVAWAPGDVRVRLRTGPEGAATAGRLERGLRDTGFRVRERRPAGPRETPPETTRITYPPREERRARALAAALPGAELHPVRGHPRVLEVRPGRDGVRVARVVHDRSSVQGRPVTGDTLDCDRPAE
ncbi:LCP family protein [Streptomyces sp. JJ36]|uniref:LCP family protein n=1 Tax=Streptomyces sp. JJ36 TaxID=2736645 RepID=UPI001F1D5425|nr:LCP family protein [Streptomyces sp. JJ36]MCF6525359.1 LCP family protein [Streptomyces sp. JJ36]